MLFSSPLFCFFTGRAIDLPLLPDATMLAFVDVTVQATTYIAASSPRTAVAELPAMGRPTVVLKSAALLRWCTMQDKCPTVTANHDEPPWYPNFTAPPLGWLLVGPMEPFLGRTRIEKQIVDQ